MGHLPDHFLVADLQGIGSKLIMDYLASTSLYTELNNKVHCLTKQSEFISDDRICWPG